MPVSRLSTVDERTTTPLRPRPAAPPIVSVGAMLGPYRLMAELGSGGMATVYLAAHETDKGERKLALKVLHEHLARDREHVNAFLDEGRIGLLLRHPAVCKVLGYGDEHGRPYVAMELVDGVPLEAIQSAIEDKPQLIHSDEWPRQVCSVIAALADGLHAAHELVDESGEPLALVHRDVTPENLYVTTDGGVRLADFGVARHRAQRHQTREGVIKGKLAYAAPELFYGKLPDRRIDVWSLGVVLWELLTGRPLFRFATDAEMTRAILDGEIHPPSRFQAAAAGQLDLIVLQALARDPDRRFDNARALANALRSWLARKGGEPDMSARRDWLVGLAVSLARVSGRA
jgi:eukaryotic-like serine/threonine-protein kinase